MRHFGQILVSQRTWDKKDLIANSGAASLCFPDFYDFEFVSPKKVTSFAFKKDTETTLIPQFNLQKSTQSGVSK